MQHLYKNLGTLATGVLIEVQLRNQANVRLMTMNEYKNFKSGRRYSYIGGRATQSPVRLAIPRDDDWVVVIDLGGYDGRIHASVLVHQQ